MEGDKWSNFPSGSGGGGGNRGSGVRSSLFYSYDSDDSDADYIVVRDDDKNMEGNINNRSAANNKGNVINWLNGQNNEGQNAGVNGRNLNLGSTSSSSDRDFGLNNERYDGMRAGSERAEGFDSRGRQNGYTYTSYIGVASFVGYGSGPNIQGAYGFASYVGAPVQGQGGPALRLDGSNANNYSNRLVVGNSVNHAFQGEHSRNVQVPGHGGMFDRFYGMGFHGNVNTNRLINGSIFYYASNTAYAYRRLNGDILSEMLSLRDGHIFNIITAVRSIQYAGAIHRISTNVDLVEAMINHLDCLKALLVRNIMLALAKQIACVNAVMKLLSEPYRNHEEWTFPVIYAVTMDLRIICDKSVPITCIGRPILHYNWNINNVICLVHPPNCHCRHMKIYRSRRFYRRF